MAGGFGDEGVSVAGLLSLKDVALSFGGEPLLDGVDFEIAAGERVSLLGRNGCGKTTLMRIVAGRLKPDRGRVLPAPHLRLGWLEQELPGKLPGTVYDVVAGGLGQLEKLLLDYHAAGLRVAAASGEKSLAELARLEAEIEKSGAWRLQQQIELVLTRLKLDPDHPFATLSGGLQRRVLLARALAADPHLLLLDEPTNHLDIEAIEWLEEFLKKGSPALLFVTHDRRLVRNLATRIVELDRGRLTSWPGDFANYLRRRAERAHAEAVERQRFDKKLALEEEWIRKGIKARRTRNEGRVRALEEMRQRFRERRQAPGRAKMEIGRAGFAGKVVAALEEVSFSYGGREIISGLTTTILKGDKIGLIGPNGSGKTTLLKLLLGELAPTSGRLRRRPDLVPLYFDQRREELDGEKTVFENIGQGNDTVEVNGRRRHVIGYLKDFLFTPDRARVPVRILSGGERNRLLLARLFTRPADLLILDEPTNDLDIETLELLEELLVDYRGTLLLVSHDREFLDNVVTSSLVFAGAGRVVEYAGGYSDWLAQKPENGIAGETGVSLRPADRPKNSKPRTAKPRKLTFKEKEELATLPARLEELEQEQQQLYARLADPEIYREDDGRAVAAAKKRLTELEKELELAYGRWEELETIREQAES